MIIVELVTGAVFGFEFVDDTLKWVLHLGFIRIMKLSKDVKDEDSFQ